MNTEQKDQYVITLQIGWKLYEKKGAYSIINDENRFSFKSSTWCLT